MFLRILPQDEISHEDIEFSRVLIDEFHIDYKELYGKENQTINIHCLQHIPNQVENYGPIHKCDCFPFEGWFKNTKLFIIFESEDEPIKNPELKCFVEKILQPKYSCTLH